MSKHILIHNNQRKLVTNPHLSHPFILQVLKSMVGILCIGNARWLYEHFAL